MHRLTEILRYRYMLYALVRAELRTRYKGSVLGFLWTFLNPILMLVVYNLVFSTVLRFNIPHYSAFLFIGLLGWNVFSTAIQSATTVIMRQSSLVKKIYFPREILPLSVVGGSVINYLLSLLILLPFLLLSGFHVTWYWVYTPLVLLIEILFVVGFAFFFSAINVFLRDVEHMMGIVLMLWFYITPVFYATTMIPVEYRQYYRWNFMSDITQMFQSIFYYGQIPSQGMLTSCAIAGMVVMISGWTVFGVLSRRFAEEV